MQNITRVLHVVHGMDCGGAENLIMNLYRAIDRNKIQFDFLVHTDKDCFFDKEIEGLGGHIYKVPYYNGINIFSYKTALNRFFDQHNEIDIVHGHLGSCAGIYLDVARKHGVYAIAHSHNTTPKQLSLKNIVYRFGNLKTRKVADYYFGCSLNAGIDRFGKQIVDGQNYKMLKNAIDAKKYSFSAKTRIEVREELGISEHDFVVGNVARFNTQKNHTFLLKIFSEIVKIEPNTKLVLVGDGNLKADILAEAKTLGINERVILTGLRNDVNRIMQAMDCFVLPSLYEGLPLVMVEAQAADLPCFISNMVPCDCIILDSVEVISLSQSAKEWAERIVATKGYQRTSTLEEIQRAGFDIDYSVDWLENFYTVKRAK